VCAIGLSAGFVEPLEATGITFTTAVVGALTRSLNKTGNVWGNNPRHMINYEFKEMSDEIFTFVWAHYHYCTKSDTPFWQDIRKQRLEDLPQYAQDILKDFLPAPKRFLLRNPFSMFGVVQWFAMFKAGGAYDNIPSILTDKQKRYSKYFIDSHTKRVELAEEMFSNQYKYLTEWYR
jgi:tryptophan halogenase